MSLIILEAILHLLAKTRTRKNLRVRISPTTFGKKTPKTKNIVSLRKRESHLISNHQSFFDALLDALELTEGSTHHQSFTFCSPN